MFRGCIFDLDGTLLNTLQTIAYYGNQTLAQFHLPAIKADEYRYLVGDGAKMLIHRMLERCGISDDQLQEEVYRYYVAAYDKDPYYLTEPYAGIDMLLGCMKQHKMKLAVLSNKPHEAARHVIQRFFGEGLFDVVYGAMAGFLPKPDTRLAFQLLDELGLSARECLYIGDTNVDMLTGRAAGMYTVGVLWGFRDRAELQHNGADRIIAEPRELLSLCIGQA